ncbi:hypothetical protein J6590_011889 [Homalodisca vitripennis]|nr:hypothetical protein J6590_011889 [Homalodisca vitripennis]
MSLCPARILSAVGRMYSQISVYYNEPELHIPLTCRTDVYGLQANIDESNSCSQISVSYNESELHIILTCGTDVYGLQANIDESDS